MPKIWVKVQQQHDFSYQKINTSYFYLLYFLLIYPLLVPLIIFPSQSSEYILAESKYFQVFFDQYVSYIQLFNLIILANTLMQALVYILNKLLKRILSEIFNSSQYPLQYQININRLDNNMKTILIFMSVMMTIWSIGVPLHDGPRCMIIQGEFDPIKLELKFPEIPNKKQDEKFKVTLTNYQNQDLLFDVMLEQKTIYRKNLNLTHNIIFQLCLEVYTLRNGFNENEKIYVEYTADQDFDALIGKIEVPEQLRGQANLQFIYNISTSIAHLNKRIAQNQGREREIEDHIASSNLHKNERINMFTIIQCVVIVASGVYQVLALRRFLIEKNLY